MDQDNSSVDASKMKEEPVIVGVVTGIGVAVLLLAIFCTIACCVHRRKQKPKERRRSRLKIPPHAMPTGTHRVTTRRQTEPSPRELALYAKKKRRSSASEKRSSPKETPSTTTTTTSSEGSMVDIRSLKMKQWSSFPERLAAAKGRGGGGYSLLDSPTPTSVLDRPELDPPPKRSARGSLQFAVRFMPNSSLVIVTVIRATGLIAANPYVKVYVAPNWGSYSKRKTDVVWNDRHPNYNETFTIERKASELGDSTIILRVLNADQLARHVLLGDVIVPLANASSQSYTAWQNLDFDDDVQRASVSVTLALCLYPDINLFSVAVERVDGLTSELTDGYCKGYLYTERALVGKLTTNHVGPTLAPSFEKVMAFNVRMLPVDRLSVVVHVKDASRAPYDRILGRIVLGSLAFSDVAKQHYLDAVSNPGTTVREQHALLIE